MTPCDNGGSGTGEKDCCCCAAAKAVICCIHAGATGAKEPGGDCKCPPDGALGECVRQSGKGCVGCLIVSKLTPKDGCCCRCESTTCARATGADTGPADADQALCSEQRDCRKTPRDVQEDPTCLRPSFRAHDVAVAAPAGRPCDVRSLNHLGR